MPPPVNQTRRDATPHPSTRSGQPYSQDMREMAMTLMANGTINEPAIQQLRNQNQFPSVTTIRRWVQLEQELGHHRACRRNGNTTASTLRGHDLVLLSLYRVVHPKAQIAEINAFLYRCNFGNPTFRFYSPSQISKAESILDLRQKRGSTTAYQAYLPINIMKRWRYFNLPYPLGIADICKQDMIDCNEAGVFLETSNRGTGKAHKTVRVISRGPYSKTEKWNLMLGVSGEEGGVENPSRRWRTLWLRGGTTIVRVLEFVNLVLADIGHGTPQRRYCFTMDNLSAHKNQAVAALIHGHGHRLVFRAPYYPMDGPIEYIFNTLQGLLRSNMHNINDSATLLNEIGNAIGVMDDFSPYFLNCGFWRN